MFLDRQRIDPMIKPFPRFHVCTSSGGSARSFLAYSSGIDCLQLSTCQCEFTNCECVVSDLLFTFVLRTKMGNSVKARTWLRAISTTH